MLSGSAQLGFSEPELCESPTSWNKELQGCFFNSLKMQLEFGVDTEHLRCNNPNHMLVLRTNGNVACVSERSAERMGWSIINDQPTPKIFLENMTATTDFRHEPDSLAYLKSTTVNSSEDFAIWTPVLKEKHLEVAELFVNALGDKIIEKVSDTEKATAYTTENGSIVLFTDPTTVAHDIDAGIKYHTPTPLYDADERKRFVYNFMDAVGFAYDKKDLQINSISSKYTLYKFEDDKNFVEFRFGNPPGQGIALRFNGYSNDPTPLVYTLTPDEAINKVYSQFPAGMVLSEWVSNDEQCLHEPLPQDRVHISKIIVSGEPYYYMVIGYCTYPSLDFTSSHLYVILDATEGETMFHWLWAGD